LIDMPSEVGSPQSGHLRSVYTNKCTALGLPPNAAIARRLGQLDSSRGRVLDLSGIPCDDTFDCIMDVVVVATGVTTVDLSGCKLTNAHVDTLVHHLSRSVGLTTLRLARNPAINDEGAVLLLDLLSEERGIRSVDVTGCAVSDSLMQDLKDAARRNVTPMATPKASEDGDGDVTLGEQAMERQRLAFLNRTRSFQALSFARLSSELLLPPSPTFGERSPGMRSGRGASALEPPSALLKAPEGRSFESDMPLKILFMLRDLCLAVVSALRRSLAVFMWHSPMHTLIVAAMCLAIAGVPFIEISAWRNALLVGSLGLVQQRIRRPPSEVALSVVTRSEEEWQRKFPLLRWVVTTERRLASDNSEQVTAAVYSIVEVVHAAFFWATGRGRRLLAVALFMLFVCALCDALSYVFFVVVCAYFGYTPVRIARRRLRSFATTQLNPFASLGGELANPDDAFHPYQFTVTLHRLVGVSVRHVSDAGFVPFVQVKYQRGMYLFPKVQDPYEWNLTSTTRFTAAAGGFKLLVTVYDDSAEVVGPALQGFVIIDECTPLNEEIVVPLTASRREHTLVHELIDEVQRHDAEARRRFGGASAGVRATKGSVTVETPGNIILRLNEVTPQRKLSTAKSATPSIQSEHGIAPASFRIAVEPASPQAASASPQSAEREPSPPLTGYTPPQWVASAMASAAPTPRPPPAQPLSKGAPDAVGRSVESIAGDSQSVGGRSSSVTTATSTSRRGPVVYKMGGSFAS
jgi:hypothetical protein